MNNMFGGLHPIHYLPVLTPFIIIYSSIYLIGSALYSSLRYARIENRKNRAIGNALITIGALLPGIGGVLAKAGMMEALYVGEFIGIILIYIGYRACLIQNAPAQYP